MKGFFGVFIAFLLVNMVVLSETLQEEKTQILLESKQRMMEYQKTEQKRTEFQLEFETAASLAAKSIDATLTTPEAEAIFCAAIIIYMSPAECSTAFDINVFEKRATLKQDLVLERENYNLIFQKGGFFE